MCRPQVKWLRPHEFKDVEQPELFYDDADDDTGDGGAEANDIIQGMLGDCYFLSALAIMCTSEGLGLVEKLFVEMKYFHKGLVGVKFFKNGLWWDVAIGVNSRALCIVHIYLHIGSHPNVRPATLIFRRISRHLVADHGWAHPAFR